MSMTDTAPPTPEPDSGEPDRPPTLLVALDRIGAPLATVVGWTLSVLDHTGHAMLVLWQATAWLFRGLFSPAVRLGRKAIVSQVVRVGAKSVFIVSVVSSAVGLILTIQLIPNLDDFGQRALVANIISIAVLRELGPLIGAIVLTGFAGAAIAAEIGTMVVGEEIEALEAHALNPVRFLVVPRVLASTVAMTCLSVISSFVAILASLLISITAFGIPYEAYMNNMLTQSTVIDFLTGTFKGTIFGMLIGIIACVNGLKVTGGAAGVGNATTYTVVQCVVAIIFADLVFTAIFFAIGLK